MTTNARPAAALLQGRLRRRLPKLAVAPATPRQSGGFSPQPTIGRYRKNLAAGPKSLTIYGGSEGIRILWYPPNLSLGRKCQLEPRWTTSTRSIVCKTEKGPSMHGTELLSRVRIASPCSKPWGDMRGDDQSRFCDQCGKHVFNFAEMTSQEVIDLIQEKEGALCGRLYQRRDGTLLTSDCPISALRFRKRIRGVVLATAMICILTVGTSLSASFSRSLRYHPTKTRERVAEVAEHVLWQVKEWLGLNPVYTTTGIVCVPVNSQPEKWEETANTD